MKIGGLGRELLLDAFGKVMLIHRIFHLGWMVARLFVIVSLMTGRRLGFDIAP